MPNIKQIAFFLQMSCDLFGSNTNATTKFSASISFITPVNYILII